MKHVLKAILLISVFLHANGLDAQDDFISALRLDFWAPGALVLKDGRAVSGKLNYDYANHFVQVQQGDSIRLYNESLTSSIHFDWFDTPDKTTFRNLRIHGPERMYRVLFENSQFAFLSYYEVDIKTAGPLATTDRPKGVVLVRPTSKLPDADQKTLYFHSWKERFVLVTATGEMRELGAFFIQKANANGQVHQGALMTKKGLLKKLRDLHPEVKDFLAARDIDLDNRHHIMQVFKEVTGSIDD